MDRFVRGHFNDLWKRRDAETLAANCSPSLGFLGSTNRAFSGLAHYRDFVASVTSPFADLELQMDEVYWMGNDHDGYLTSERWERRRRSRQARSLWGTDGPGGADLGRHAARD